MAYEYLKKLFKEDENGNMVPMTYEELEAAIDSDKSIGLVNLKDGGYVSKDKLDAKITEVDGLKQQLDDANAEITSYKEMDIDGIQQKAADWEAKYNADTQALSDKLAQQERNHQIERFFDQYQFSSKAARKGILDEFNEKEFKLDNGKFLGAEDFMKDLMEDEDYKGAFVVEETKPDTDPEDTPPAPDTPPQQPMFAAGTNTQQQEQPKGSLFGFGFTGVRKRD